MSDSTESPQPSSSVPPGPSSTRLVVVLTAVCAISALLVAVSRGITAKPIAEAKVRERAALLREVLPPDIPDPEERALLADDGTTNFVYYAADGAIALEAETAHGYGGPLRLLVGFDRNRNLYSFKVLEHSETPGLGANLAQPENAVLASAKGKPADGTRWAVTKDGGAIDALTAATISSRAACEALDLAAKRLSQIPSQP